MVIKKRSPQKSLTGLNRRNRSKMMKQVFYYKMGYCDIEIPVVLVDDFLTTGSTLRFCRDLLEENKRIVLGAPVLALA